MNTKPDTQSDTAPLHQDSGAAEGKECDIENALDEALEESFPASDPVAITIEKPSCPPI
ncbi:hypothetical protein [Collimonas antrihumi]|uniref:hypothetical protein n=1 Tax=Collimonas antrihumi TaxID=1940615 RepID=UPI001B8CE213|nr:hypothetical protein [Collimonas antrihumi]